MTDERQRRLDDPFPTTRSGVREELEYWAPRQHYGEPGSNDWLGVEQRLVHLRHLDQRMTMQERTQTTSHQGLLVFISHSSEDETLAKALIYLLKSAIGLTANQIRCSSVDGYRLSVGVDTEEKIREEINAARIVIGLITPNSLASHFVMFELGARWGGNLFVAPLLAGVEPRDLRAPLSLLNALSARSASQLHQLIENVAQLLEISPQGAASYSNDLDQVRQLADETPRTRAISNISSDAPKMAALQQDNTALVAENAQLREQLRLRETIKRINQHTYIDGDDAEMCARCLAAQSLAIPLQDMNLDGRGMKATCPQCKMPRGNGPPIPKSRSEQIA